MQPKSFFFFSFELSVNRLQFSYLFSPHIFVLWISSLSSSRSVAHSQTILQEHLKLSVQTMFLIPVAWYSTKNASHLQIFYNNNNNNKKLKHFSLYLPEKSLKKYQGWDVLSVRVCRDRPFVQGGCGGRASAVPPSRGRCETPAPAPARSSLLQIDESWMF